METLSTKFLPDMDLDKQITVLPQDSCLSSTEDTVKNRPDIGEEAPTSEKKKDLYNPFSSSSEPGDELPNPEPDAVKPPSKPLFPIINCKKDTGKSPTTKKTVQFSDKTETIEPVDLYSSDEETEDENAVREVQDADKSDDDVQEIVDEIVEEISQKKTAASDNDDEICVLEDASSETLTSTPIKDDPPKSTQYRDPIYYSELSDCEAEPRPKRKRLPLLGLAQASRRIVQDGPKSRPQRRSAPGRMEQDALAQTVAHILPATPYSQSLLDSLTKRNKVEERRSMRGRPSRTAQQAGPAKQPANLDDSDIIIDYDFEKIKELEKSLARTCNFTKKPSNRIRTRSSVSPVVRIKRCDYMLRGRRKRSIEHDEEPEEIKTLKSSTPLSFWESAERGNLLPDMFDLISNVFRKKFRTGSHDRRTSLTNQLNSLIDELEMGDLLKNKLEAMQRDAKSELSTYAATLEEEERNAQKLRRQLLEAQENIEARRQQRRVAERKASVLDSLVSGRKRRY